MRHCKVASADLNYGSYVEKNSQARYRGSPDTGNSTFGEIETAVDVLRGRLQQNHHP